MTKIINLVIVVAQEQWACFCSMDIFVLYKFPSTSYIRGRNFCKLSNFSSGQLLPFTSRISAGGSSIDLCVSLCISFVTKPLFHSHHGNEGNGLETVVILLSIFFIKCLFVMTWRIWNGKNYKTVGIVISLPVYITYNFVLDFGLPESTFFFFYMNGSG